MTAPTMTDLSRLPIGLLPNADHASPIRFAMCLLVFGFGGFLLWACLAPLDEGVPTPGVVGVESKRKRVEHLSGGSVELILVKEGQQVSAGQDLVVLNGVQSQAVFDAVRSQWLIASATVARLQAERVDGAVIRFSSELEKDSAADVKVVLAAQRDVLASRRLALDGELRIVRESTKGLQSQLISLVQLKNGREKQVSLIKDQLGRFEALQQQGFVSQNQLLDMERQLSEVQSKQAEDLSAIAAINARFAEFKLRDQQILNDYQKDVELQLIEAVKELSIQSERMKSSTDNHNRLVIRSPVSGTVVDVAVNTVGGVVKPGDRVMDIVPEGEELVVEAQLAPQFIDRVRPGLPAYVSFDAYVSMVRRPRLQGVVKTVSADVLTDPRTGASYYTVQVSMSPEELAQLQGVKLFVGMQCSVTIKTGDRTMMAYLMRPLLQKMESAFLEY